MCLLLGFAEIVQTSRILTGLLEQLANIADIADTKTTIPTSAYLLILLERIIASAMTTGVKDVPSATIVWSLIFSRSSRQPRLLSKWCGIAEKLGGEVENLKTQPGVGALRPSDVAAMMVVIPLVLLVTNAKNAEIRSNRTIVLLGGRYLDSGISGHFDLFFILKP